MLFKEKNELEYDSKIHINCGYCGLLKGCVIRKTFIETAKKFTNKAAQLKFKLECPFETQKYKGEKQYIFGIY